MLSFLLVALAIFAAIPTSIFAIEVVAALALPSWRRERFATTSADAVDAQRVAVLVPAHNEGSGLIPTLADLKAQLRKDGRLLVIADNCSDDTAATARAAGAEVVERFDSVRRGKAYALDFGIAHLRSSPPDAVIVVDADCRVSDTAIDTLARLCAETKRPVQALDLMTAPHPASVHHQVAEFAWMIKNWARPTGLAKLGFPCHLMGTGMAFPWPLISSSRLASSHLAEDLQLGIDLALDGAPPLFCPTAVVTSAFPSSPEAAKKQRTRWEHGHISLLKVVPGLICRAIARRDVGLIALALDLAVPPLALLSLVLVAIATISGLAALAGAGSAALIVSGITLSVFAASLLVSWFQFGRKILPLRNAFGLAAYFGAKLGLYYRLLTNGFVSEWVRTDRR